MLFNINGANIVHATPHVINLNVTEQRNLTYPKFRFKAAPNGEDSGLFEAKLFASDNTYFGAIRWSGLDPFDLARIRPGTDDIFNNPSGDNGANPPSIIIGNQNINQSSISFYVFTGTANGVPNTLPTAWFNLRMEIKLAGAVNRTILIQNPLDLNLPAVYVAEVNDTGFLKLIIPITVTL